MKKIIFLLAVLFSFNSQAAEISDFAIKDNKILNKNKEINFLKNCLPHMEIK